VGYDEQIKGFRIWIPAKQKIVLSYNVKFDETIIVNKSIKQPIPATITLPPNIESMSNSREDRDHVEPPISPIQNETSQQD